MEIKVLLIIIAVVFYIIFLIIGLSPFILSSMISRWEEKTGKRDIDD